MQKTLIEARISGIPCLIQVNAFQHYAGCHSGSSDWDYHGFCEMDWDVLDRRGRKAAWLAKKLTSSDESRIESEIAEYFQDDGY